MVAIGTPEFFTNIDYLFEFESFLAGRTGDDESLIGHYTGRLCDEQDEKQAGKIDPP